MLTKAGNIDMRGRSWSGTAINGLLLPLTLEKVLTEAELLKRFNYVKEGTTGLSQAYRSLRESGFPIRRRELDQVPPRGSTRGFKRQSKNRVVIYYLE